MFDTALIEAEALDREFAATGKLKGLLHSVPVSLKDLRASPLPTMNLSSDTGTLESGRERIGYDHRVHAMGRQARRQRRGGAPSTNFHPLVSNAMYLSSS